MKTAQELEKNMQESMQHMQQVAKNMLKEGSEIEFIEKITGLTKEIIEKLKQNGD
jgi:hypothetical protein